jgi:hypothetical protein
MEVVTAFVDTDRRFSRSFASSEGRWGVRTLTQSRVPQRSSGIVSTGMGAPRTFFLSSPIDTPFLNNSFVSRQGSEFGSRALAGRPDGRSNAAETTANPDSLVPGSLVPGSLVPDSLVPGSLVWYENSLRSSGSPLTTSDTEFAQ